MEKKLDIYRHYKHEMGISLNKRERDKVLKNYDSTAVEILMGRKMFTKRQVEAAIRIQCWWRKTKMRAWFSIIQKIRHHSAQKIQRAWKYFMMIRVWPAMLEDMQQKASLLLQSRMKGYLARKHIEQELNVHRMESCF